MWATVVRAGVVACVAAASLVAVGGLEDAVAVFDFKADANAVATYADRTYPEIEWLQGGSRVIEDGRLWMPEDATYATVYTPDWARRAGSLDFFLRLLLYPREQTEADAAPWLYCLGCSRASLEPEYEVLSDSGHGFLFARRRT